MSKFLPYIEDDGNIYVYEFESGTPYRKNEMIYANDIFYRVVADYTSGSNPESDYDSGKLEQFNKLDMEGGLLTIGPVDSNTGRRFGNNDVTLSAPQDYFVVGYRLYGVGANNYPDGGRTGSSMRHWMYAKKMKKD